MLIAIWNQKKRFPKLLADVNRDNKINLISYTDHTLSYINLQN